MNHQKTRADAFRRARAAHRRASEAVAAMLADIYGGDEDAAIGAAFEATRLVVEAANLALALRKLAGVHSLVERSSKSAGFADPDMQAAV